MVLTGGARTRLDRMTPDGHAVRIHLTITDDFPYAHAFVMIEAVPG
jgi:holo-[acyl-carrier protein] synthase